MAVTEAALGDVDTTTRMTRTPTMIVTDDMVSIDVIAIARVRALGE
jgi:hypothetical protein